MNESFIDKLNQFGSSNVVKRAFIFFLLLGIAPQAFANDPSEYWIEDDSMIVVDSEQKSQTQPGVKALLLASGLMAIADYFVQTTVHEGAHALTAELFGSHVTKFRILPERVNGDLRFGYVRYKGRLSRDERALFLLAPKIANFMILAGYTLMFETDSMPENRYAQLAILIAASGAAIDFIKDVVDTRKNSDMPRVFELYNFSHDQEIAARVLQMAIVSFAVVEIGRGFYRLFTNASATDKMKESGGVPFFIIGPDSSVMVGFRGDF